MKQTIITPDTQVRIVHADGKYRIHFLKDGRHYVHVVVGVFEIDGVLYWQTEGG